MILYTFVNSYIGPAYARSFDNIAELVKYTSGLVHDKKIDFNAKSVLYRDSNFLIIRYELSFSRKGKIDLLLDT